MASRRTSRAPVSGAIVVSYAFVVLAFALAVTASATGALSAEVASIAGDLSQEHHKWQQLGDNAAAGVLEPAAEQRSRKLLASGCASYTIRKGDTLWALSQRLGTTVAVLTSINPGIVPTNLRIGQVINIPPCNNRDPDPVGPSGGCPSGWRPAVGTLFDSWPKPNTEECNENSGCEYAGQFNNIDAGGNSRSSCRNGARWLDGGDNRYACRFPESLVKSWNIAATYQRDAALLGRKLEVMIQGRSNKVVTVNILDVCNDDDCDGCCRRNTGNKAYKLIDLEKWPGSVLLGYNPSGGNFDINDVSYPTSKGLRPGAPEGDVMPLCYRDVGSAIRVG